MPSIISDAALLSAFSHLEPYPTIALAVSGGPDSMALMHLTRRWLSLTGREAKTVTVVTVDHGLRPESAEEAALVARQAQQLGFAHATLTWIGEKPKAGLQAAARSARYSLMADYCRSNRRACLLTGHTEDDQAETFLMRLRRGSGLDGLSSMAAVSEQNGISIVRPLLGFSKARLIDYLRAKSVPFAYDRSNDDTTFERVRLRHAMKASASAGISASSLARAAVRLGRSREALDRITDDFLEAHFQVSHLGRGAIGVEQFKKITDDIALRALSRVLTLVSGKPTPARLSRLEHLLQDLKNEVTRITLGGCLIRVAKDKLYFYRELGRMKAARVPLELGHTMLWDGRFLLTVSDEADANGVVRPLGKDGWVVYRNALKNQGNLVEADRLAAMTTPALWMGNHLMCAPALKFINDNVTETSTPPLTVMMVPGLARFIDGAKGALGSVLGKDSTVPYL